MEDSSLEHPKKYCTCSTSDSFSESVDYASTTETQNIHVSFSIHKKELNLPIKLKALLDSFNVCHPIFPSKKSLFTISRSSTIQEALNVLFEHKVLSVPVMDIDQEVAVNVLSLNDLVNLFATVFSKEDFLGGSLYQLVQKKQELNKIRIYQLEGLEKPFFVKESDRVLDAAKIMLKHHAHRVLIIDEVGKLSGMITQSQIIELIAFSMDNLNEDILWKTVEELRIGYQSVASVRISQMALEAFSIMKEKRVSGVAVLNDNGILQGSISVSDIRKLGYRMVYFEILGRTVGEYLESLKGSTTTNTKRPELLTCQPEDLFIDVIRKISLWKVHRIFLVDREMKLIGVISLFDILNRLLCDTIEVESCD